MAISDMNNQNRGFGKWKIFTYNPQTSISNIEGVLIVTKDFHIIYKDDKLNCCLLNVPSQNVAFLVNESQVNNYKLDK